MFIIIISIDCNIEKIYNKIEKEKKSERRKSVRKGRRGGFFMEYIEESLRTQVYGEYDAIVVGAGPAGCAAGLSCARGGLKTLIIDRFNCLGGAWTTGFMNPLFDGDNKDGVLKELIDDLNSKGQWGGFWDKSFNYEYMKCLLDDKLSEAGAEILFNTYFSDVIREDKTVKGIIAENRDGRRAYLAKYVIDCTGDGNVAAAAGCDFELGDNGDYTKCQAMTLMFLVGNIPPKYKDGAMIGEQLSAVYEKAGKEIPFTAPYLIPAPNSSFGVVQFTHMYRHNPLSAKEITEATMEGRRQMIDAFEALTKYDEDFKDLDLIASSAVLGIRESRRICGEYTISDENILEGARFDDGVAEAAFSVDIHTEENKGQCCFKVKPYQIPLRSMIPKGYDGLFVACRCISGSQTAMASYRVTGNCAKMGDSLGRRLAYAAKNSLDVREVNVKEALA